MHALVKFVLFHIWRAICMHFYMVYIIWNFYFIVLYVILWDPLGNIIVFYVDIRRCSPSFWLGCAGLAGLGWPGWAVLAGIISRFWQYLIISIYFYCKSIDLIDLQLWLSPAVFEYIWLSLGGPYYCNPRETSSNSPMPAIVKYVLFEKSRAICMHFYIDIDRWRN